MGVWVAGKTHGQTFNKTRFRPAGDPAPAAAHPGSGMRAVLATRGNDFGTDVESAGGFSGREGCVCARGAAVSPAAVRGCERLPEGAVAPRDCLRSDRQRMSSLGRGACDVADGAAAPSLPPAPGRRGARAPCLPFGQRHGFFLLSWLCPWRRGLPWRGKWAAPGRRSVPQLQLSCRGAPGCRTHGERTEREAGSGDVGGHA